MVSFWFCVYWLGDKCFRSWHGRWNVHWEICWWSTIGNNEETEIVSFLKLKIVISLQPCFSNQIPQVSGEVKHITMLCFYHSLYSRQGSWKRSKIILQKGDHKTYRKCKHLESNGYALNKGKWWAVILLVHWTYSS